MERQLVESSQLKSVGYDVEGGILEIEFKSGGIYQYLGVPPIAHKDLMAAESVGKYFGKHIRNKFITTKQEPPEKAEGAANGN